MIDQRALNSKAQEISFLRDEMSRLKHDLEAKLDRANESAERSATAAQVAAQEAEERRATVERTRTELDECRRRLEQLGVDAVSLKKWTAVCFYFRVPAFSSLRPLPPLTPLPSRPPALLHSCKLAKMTMGIRLASPRVHA